VLIVLEKGDFSKRSCVCVVNGFYSFIVSPSVLTPLSRHAIQTLHHWALDRQGPECGNYRE